ncbi:hypothetical protein FB480_11822 [Agrobacterium vitis]|nr:hypothetical protein FB480_11822 [Agrobacterium vitis]
MSHARETMRFSNPLILQRLSPNMAHKTRCNTLNLLHNFLLISIPISGIMQEGRRTGRRIDECRVAVQKPNAGEPSVKR